MDDLAGALEGLLGSPELRDRLGRSGQNHARGFSYQDAAKAHLYLFKELLQGPK
jgi:hypothetical protein